MATMNSTKPFASWNSDKWDGFLRAFLKSLLNVVAIVCVCDKESFGYLMAYVHKSRFVAKFIFECGYYEPQIEELPFAWSTMMETSMLSFLCPPIPKVGGH
jgi:capsule polysaccharide modification protein KpsS